MADIGFIRGLLRGIEDEKTKRILTEAFEHVLGNLRFGEPIKQTRATNMQMYFQSSTTASSTDTTFTIEHGMGVQPSYLIPVVDVRQVGATNPQFVVTKIADNRRIYLKPAAGSTNAAFKFLLE